MQGRAHSRNKTGGSSSAAIPLAICSARVRCRPPVRADGDAGRQATVCSPTVAAVAVPAHAESPCAHAAPRYACNAASPCQHGRAAAPPRRPRIRRSKRPPPAYHKPRHASAPRLQTKQAIPSAEAQPEALVEVGKGRRLRCRCAIAFGRIHIPPKVAMEVLFCPSRTPSSRASAQKTRYAFWYPSPEHICP